MGQMQRQRRIRREMEGKAHPKVTRGWRSRAGAMLGFAFRDMARAFQAAEQQLLRLSPELEAAIFSDLEGLYEP